MTSVSVRTVRVGGSDQNSTYFADGHAEFKQNGDDWDGWAEWGVPHRTDGDLQFYFTLE